MKKPLIMPHKFFATLQACSQEKLEYRNIFFWKIGLNISLKEKCVKYDLKFIVAMFFNKTVLLARKALFVTISVNWFHINFPKSVVNNPDVINCIKYRRSSFLLCYIKNLIINTFNFQYDYCFLSYKWIFRLNVTYICKKFQANASYKTIASYVWEHIT